MYAVFILERYTYTVTCVYVEVGLVSGSPFTKIKIVGIHN